MTTEDLSHVVPVETDDGSTTLHDTERDVHYRSHHGAIQESRHVFVEGTDITDHTGVWRVAELGFGAAVNFVQTVEAFRDNVGGIRLIYHSVDWRPVTSDHLVFHQGEPAQMARDAVDAVHDGEGPVVTVESEDSKVVLHLHATPWDDAQLYGVGARAFYHDPFSKRVNPEAWTTESFQRAKAAMDAEGRLATYSAATSVKTAMFEAGLWVASAPGPGRKREMTVASASRAVLERQEGLQLLDREKYVG